MFVVVPNAPVKLIVFAALCIVKINCQQNIDITTLCELLTKCMVDEI